MSSDYAERTQRIREEEHAEAAAAQAEAEWYDGVLHALHHAVVNLGFRGCINTLIDMQEAERARTLDRTPPTAEEPW